MFTIKHIDKKNTEHLIEANSVWYQDNAEKALDTNEPVVRTVQYTTGQPNFGGYVIRTLDFGMVYVMNRYGKTVADYALGGDE